jgi:hypothetical protein
LNLEINKRILYTWNGFEQSVREENAHIAILKSKGILVDNLLKETAELETGMAEKFNWDQTNSRRYLVWFGEI